MSSPGDALAQLQAKDKEIAALKAAAADAINEREARIAELEAKLYPLGSTALQDMREGFSRFKGGGRESGDGAGRAPPEPDVRGTERDETPAKGPIAAAQPRAAERPMNPAAPIDTHDHEYFFEFPKEPKWGNTIYVKHSAICWCKEAARAKEAK